MVAVVNFPEKKIGPFLSQVLTLGLPDNQGAVVLLGADIKVPNGARVF